MQYILTQMDKQPGVGGTELLRQINILDTVYWISQAWKEVETSTISKCFEKAGFIFPTDEPNTYNTDDEEDEEDEDDDIPLSVLKLSNELFGCDFSDLMQLDQEINICDTNTIDWNVSAQQILNMEKESDEDISDDPGDEDPCVPSISDAHIYLENMKTFAQHQGHASLLEHVMISCDIVNSISVTKSKQTTITDFFKSN